MFPLHVRKEIDAHIADRFLEAVWREALWLVKDGVATTEEIDEAIRMGFGLRWGQMGLFETYRIAGGEAGMKHFLAQFGPCLTWPWTKLMDVPEFNDELVDLIAGQSDAQSGQYSIRELERIRDANLVGFLRVLKERNWGAGRVLRDHDTARRDAALAESAVGTAPLDLAHMQVLPGWIDYNGHMTESRYLFADLGDLGCLPAADRRRHGLCRRRPQLLHRRDPYHAPRRGQAGRPPAGHAAGAARRREAAAYLRSPRQGRRNQLPRIEQMLLHVDMAAGRACPAAPEVLARLMPIAEAHKALPRPAAAGRFVGAGEGEMNFGLTEEQRLIVETTRALRRERALPA